MKETDVVPADDSNALLQHYQLLLRKRETIKRSRTPGQLWDLTIGLGFLQQLVTTKEHQNYDHL
jgi:hypothetical protein